MSVDVPDLERMAPLRGRCGGRPTAAEAERRHAHLLEVAGAMFMQNGFDGTSVDAVAEAAGMSKRTVYARYSDKGALFRAVLSGLIERWLNPITCFQATHAELEPMLMDIGRHLMLSALAPHAVRIHRIIAAESERQPELARLANSEGREAGIRAIAAALQDHRDELRGQDLVQAAELFMSLTADTCVRLAAFGIVCPPAEVERRLRAAVDLFLNGLRH